MTRLRTMVGTTMARATAGLVLAVAVAFLVPNSMAAADPASDADGAITAAWDAGGGATGSLGPKDGGVYPVGDGFGQNFAGGRIYFTPDTGAHIMQGAILDKYLSLGGPVDGDLGFPNIDEGGGKAPDSRNTTFSAADNPVIFFTPDTGARVVRGAINAAWDKLGGSAGVLGVPTEDEVYRGDDVSQNFSGGQLSWNRKTGRLHDDAAGTGGSARGPRRSWRRHVGDQRCAPGGRRSDGPAGRSGGSPVQDRWRRPRAELRGRQDLLQPGHRRQRRHRAGAGQIRERRWSHGRPRLPDEQ